MRASALRRAAAALAVLAAAATLTACGDDTSGETSNVSDDQETRTITDASGAEVVVPADPQRVIALSEQDLDALLALDVAPVGTVNGRGQQGPPAYLGEDAAGIEIVGDIGAPTTDKILELEPDLVLFGAPTDEAQVEQLRELVPATVVTYNVDDDWKTAFRQTADAVNQADAAEAWLADYDAKVADAQGKLGDNSGATVSIVRWNPDGPVIMLHEAFSSLVVQDLGLVRPPTQQDPGFAHTDPLSLENLGRLDADWLFVGTLQPGSEEALSEARSTPAFAALGAVSNDRFVEVDGTLWTSRGGPLAALQVVDDVVARLGG